MLRRPADEPIKIYSIYEPSQQMGKTKPGRQTTSYAKYVANLKKLKERRKIVQSGKSL